MNFRKNLVNYFASSVLALVASGCWANDSTSMDRPIYVSMQQLLSARHEYLNKKVMVTGFLSENCSGLCLFAYEDDAVNFNEANSVKLIKDADTLNAIKKSCQESYVTIVGMIQAVDGFGLPGFSQVDQVRREVSESGGSEICWMPGGK